MKQKTPSTWALLKGTIPRLHKRAQLRTRQRRQLIDRIRYRDEKIVKLELEIARLKSITEPQAVFNCVYPAQMMALAVFIILHGGSLRCAAATVGFYGRELMGWDYSTPAWKTISNWVERCGLHALNLSKDLNGEFVAIAYATIQIGKEQLLLLLGVRPELLATLDRPLTIADVVVLGMEVQPSWTGEAIAEFIRRNLSLRPGIKLTYMVCDQGTNLLCALRLLNLPVVSDCSHVMMNLVKKIYSTDTELSKLCAAVGQLRQKLNLTDHAFLLPPTLRDKDRFLRIFTLVDWIDRIDGYWPNLSSEVRKQLKFYKNRWLNLRLRQVYQLLVLTAKTLKHHGLSETTGQQWSSELAQWKAGQSVITIQAKEFINGMQKYFATHADQYKEGARLLCCSDIIECIFGRYKNKGGMRAISADVLSIALYNQPISTTFIQTAMKSVTGPMLDDWRCENVCHNRYGIRKRMEKELKNAGG